MDAVNTSGPVPPREHYTDRRVVFESRAELLAGRSSRLSHGRTAAFIGLIAAGLWLERGGGTPAVLAGSVFLVAFIALVAAHRRVRAREQWFRDVAALNAEGVHRLDRRWDQLPAGMSSARSAGHAFAADLDLFGRASLVQILGPSGSALGAATLEGWLLEPAPPDVVRERQDAVRELASMHDLRESLAIRGRRTRDVRSSDVERFLQWAERPGSVAPPTVLRVLSYVLPATTWTLLVLHAAGVITTALWLLPMVVTFMIYLAGSGPTRRTFDEAFGREGMFSAYPELLGTAAAARFDTPLLRRLSARLETVGVPADQQLASLRKLMHLADVRLSLVHVPVYLLSMWDAHILAALQRWRARAGNDVRTWLHATGELEALCALATLAHDQPDWCFVELDAAGPAVLEATALGHPLLPDETRVCNDVVLGPPGTFLLITGSNMSGKSTLLRATGLNVVLAQAGGPSCARSLRMPPLRVQTSIRVQDSLARGVSYFMAELERLKQVVDAAHAAAAEPGVTLLFLLDEILHGTNTAERRIAARRVIRHLVDSGAIGAVTTHDLELAEEPVLAPSARLVHFQERVTEGDDRSTLDFDYRLREGLATSTNALKLMRLVGLPDSDNEPGHDTRRDPG